MIKYSVCIPSSGRESLNHLLVSVAQEHPQATEIIVASPQKISSIKNNQRIVFIDNPSGTASDARNLCASNAQGTYLIFIDDDCKVEKKYFNCLDERITASPQYVAFAGYTHREKNGSLLDNAWLEAGFDRYFSLPQLFKYLRWAPTSNLIVQKEAFFKTGGFQQTPVPVGGEDVDFGMRLYAKGLGPILAIPQAIVCHEPISSVDFESLKRKARYYGASEKWLAFHYSQYLRNTRNPSIDNPLSRQLREAFLDECAHNDKYLSLTTMADCMNSVDGRMSVMMIKPAGMPRKKEIVERLKNFGYLLLEEKRQKLTPAQIENLYCAQFRKMSPYHVENHMQYLQSDDVLAMLTYDRSIIPHNRFEVRGHHFVGEMCTAGTIRHDFKGKGVFNSFHMSAPEETSEHAQILLR